MSPVSINEISKDKEKETVPKKQISKKVLLLAVGAVLIAAILTSAIYYRYYVANDRDAASIISESKKDHSTKDKKKEEVKKQPNSLNGELVDENSAKRHPLAIIIENHPDARPQSGLTKASVVYEAITEGGITRFMAIFGPHDAPEVGPIRSARSFFIDWASEYNAYYVHAGGATDALALLPKSPVFDLPHTNGYFNRIGRGGVASEHTLYSSTAKLRELATNRKYPSNNRTESLQFKDDAKLEERGTQATITVDFSSPSYKVTWSYDKEKNDYSRSLAGTSHKDRTTSEQIKAKTIIVQEVKRQDIQLPGAKPTFKFTTIGQGKATIYQDGKTTVGTWQKGNQQSRTKFLDETNNEVKLNRGTLWIEVVPPGIPYSAI